MGEGVPTSKRIRLAIPALASRLRSALLCAGVGLSLGLPISLAAGVDRARATEPAAFPDERSHRSPVLACEGQPVQGGTLVCRTIPGSRVRLGAAVTMADREGFFVIGFDRDAPGREVAHLWSPDGAHLEHDFEVAPRSYAISRIDGLPPSQVDQYTRAQREQIEASSARKRKGDASRVSLAAFRDRFASPLAGRRTSPFGAQRILNGVEKRPHYGVDIAAAAGTPIAAPADGIVSLADDELYFEGAMIVIDHGQGFLSKYLHVSRIDVSVGERVRVGQTIGAVGSRGRSTGPHLCWRLKWRDRNLDPDLWLMESGGR